MLRPFSHPVVTSRDMLRHVGCCWLKFENGQIFHATFVDVAWCCSRLARLVQQCCVRACALVRFSIPNMSQHVATGWPNARNVLRPTMLRYVVFNCFFAFNCCDRLAGACKCWAYNVGVCCVEILRSFGRGSTYKWILLYSVSLVSFGTGVLRCNAVLYQVISKVITLSNANRLQLN